MIEGWKLHCELDGEVRLHRLELVPHRPDDPDDVLACALISGAMEVIDLAARSRFWALGRIQLVDPTGLVVEEMGAK